MRRYLDNTIITSLHPTYPLRQTCPEKRVCHLLYVFFNFILGGSTANRPTLEKLHESVHQRGYALSASAQPLQVHVR